MRPKARRCLAIFALATFTGSASGAEETPEAIAKRSHAWPCETCHLDPSTAPPASSFVEARRSVTCLSCHDGSIAGATFVCVRPANIPRPPTWGNAANHPVGMDYPPYASAAGAGLRPEEAPTGLGGTIASDLLVRHRVECGSCHRLHNTRSAALLVRENGGSALCLTCHNR